MQTISVVYNVEGRIAFGTERSLIRWMVPHVLQANYGSILYSDIEPATYAAVRTNTGDPSTSFHTSSSEAMLSKKYQRLANITKMKVCYN
jgi:hypothetical protein